jgi:hypothetical protein
MTTPAGSLELEVHGYTKSGDEASAYGRRWEYELSRGTERISVSIERSGNTAIGAEDLAPSSQ